MNGTPDAEHEITEELAGALLRDQHPDLADLPLAAVAHGFDNVVFRLGETLALRLPRRAIAAELAAHEHRWLPELAAALPLPVPVPVRVGEPALGYPWPWAVVRWVPGVDAETTSITDTVGSARLLGDFLRALHIPAPQAAPRNPWRGIPLSGRLDHTHATLAALRRSPVADRTDLDAVAAGFDAATRRPGWSGPPVWIHGDLHPRHALVEDGVLSAVIDFGDLTSGDPATDLAAVWMLLPTDVHHVFRERYRPDEDTWERGRGWALIFGAILAEVGLADTDTRRVDAAVTTLGRAIGQIRTSGA